MPATATPDGHYRALERMYLSAATNQRYRGLSLVIDDGAATVGFQATADLHHAAGGVHGSHIFKLLDDAAFFAANSVVADVFVLTAQFSIQLLASVADGGIRAQGRVTRAGSTLVFAEAVAWAGERELARGHGTFARSRQALATVPGYRVG